MVNALRPKAAEVLADVRAATLIGAEIHDSYLGSWKPTASGQHQQPQLLEQGAADRWSRAFDCLTILVLAGSTASPMV